MKKNLEILIHCIIAISTFFAIGIYFVTEVDGDSGVGCFRYFTTDSNILAFIASLLCVIFNRNDKRLHWVSILQFVATASVSLTFLMVVLLLEPMEIFQGRGVAGALMYFTGNRFILHISTPILSFIALMISKGKHSKSVCLWSLMPVFLYSLYYVIAVAILRCENDFYGLTFGGHYALAPVVMLLLYIFTALIAFVEWKLHMVIQRQKIAIK